MTSKLLHDFRQKWLAFWQRLTYVRTIKPKDVFDAGVKSGLYQYGVNSIWLEQDVIMKELYKNPCLCPLNWLVEFIDHAVHDRAASPGRFLKHCDFEQSYMAIKNCIQDNLAELQPRKVPILSEEERQTYLAQNDKPGKRRFAKFAIGLEELKEDINDCLTIMNPSIPEANRPHVLRKYISKGFEAK